ncbi:hypothetical protein [Methylomagnum ishizawai]|uniref:hypothetical protein n=1 Tax=Methylomagnum ishizawai TaxID=1760988 RepID=UPI001C322681|nr:hypothetical protein [Methylomagnum ishizawai]BBL75159.1 hypothetical protein MishRS11D_22570 [Methylomagnum ishizawai]
MNPTPGKRRARWLRLSVLTVLAGCAEQAPYRGVRPDPAQVHKIGLKIDPMLAGSRADGAKLKDMAARAARNLGGWGYAVEAGSGDFSHILEAKIDPVAHKSTPPGFSMSMGDSDPRALEFQKAYVLPVDCVIYPVARPQDRASLYMDFVAKDTSISDPDSTRTYVDHISTVCFNLLEDLKIKRTQAAPAAQKAETPANSDTWFPEVRVEVRNKTVTPAPVAAPAVPAASAPSAPPPTVPVRPVPAPAVPKPTATPSAPVPPMAAPKPAPPPVQSTAPVPSQPQAPAVTTETATDPGNGKKEMIIHNQGSPIILEFGYERK